MKVIKLKKEEAIFVGIDFQEKIMPAMKNREELEECAVKLVRGCRIMDVPILMTQQYTKGLGETVPSIAAAATEAFGQVQEDEFNTFEKTSFSAMGAPDFVEALQALGELGRKTVIIGGIECHVCVQQTVLDLLEAGYKVFLVNDCVSSRSNTDKKYSQRRMAEAGAVGTTCESVLFELCGGAGETGFKQISNLVK